MGQNAACDATRRKEALATLRDETIIIESYFLDQTAEGDFLIADMKVKDREQSRRAVANSPHDIDRYHQAIKRDFWLEKKPLEMLVDLELLDEIQSI